MLTVQMRRVHHSNITEFVHKRNITFDALYSSDSDDEPPAPAAAPTAAPRPETPTQPYDKGEDAISVWTQRVIESFEKASEVKKPLSTDFKESLGRLSFFRKSVSKEKSSSSTVQTK
jgi:hypothetical protein